MYKYHCFNLNVMLSLLVCINIYNLDIPKTEGESLKLVQQNLINLAGLSYLLWTWLQTVYIQPPNISELQIYI